MSLQRFDIVIVGAGPAGSSCALSLANAGLRVALLDRDKFPRDKICGDALSVDVINQLPMLSPELSKNFNECVSKIPSYGVRLFSPDLTRLDIPFLYQGSEKSGYTCARKDFDDLLFQQVQRSDHVTVMENCCVTEIKRSDDEVIICTNRGAYTASMVLGADGANSVVGRMNSKLKIDRRHHSAGLRVYYEGVSDFHPQNYIELYFFRNILPGYVWIFPMANNMANVGIGILSAVVSSKKINLRETLDAVLTTHPVLKKRFENARPLETVKGHGLPLGSTKRNISGDRFLLLGDAAGLIDPFSGEGIGNAIRSGRVAAGHVKSCFEQNDFSAAFNKAYDKEIYRRMEKEFRISYTLQRLCRYPTLFNYIAKKANKREYWREFLTQTLSDIDQKKQFSNPAFYYRLLFR